LYLESAKRSDRHVGVTEQCADFRDEKSLAAKGTKTAPKAIPKVAPKEALNFDQRITEVAESSRVAAKLINKALGERLERRITRSGRARSRGDREHRRVDPGKRSPGNRQHG
jgi:hypothetical protein